MATNFEIQLAKRTYRTNLVVCITLGSGDVYFTQHVVDGESFRNEYNGYVIDANVNSEQIDLRSANSSIQTIGFSLLDKNRDVSALISQDETAFMNAEIKLYMGFITGSFNFDSYLLMGTTRITSLKKTANQYSFTSKAPTGLLQSPIYTTVSSLDGDVLSTDSTLDLVDATGFPTSGTGVVESEFISWSGKTADQLTGLTRGSGQSAPLTSEDEDHDNGQSFYLVDEEENESMDIALDIILNQVGVDSDLVDSDSFTDLRDSEFSTDGDFRFYMFNIDNALEWLEENILQPTNTRLVNANGKIKIALLDQIAFSSDSETINEDHIIGDPSYSIESDKIINKILVKYDYNYGTEKYAVQTEFLDSDSITNYGLKSTLIIEMQGVTTANNGATFVSNKVSKLFARLSTPQVTIGVKTLFNRFGIMPSDKVYVEHRYLPNVGSGSGFYYMLEVLSKAPTNFKSNPYINYKLAFTSYSNLSTGLISPSPLISAVTSQTVFTVPDGSLFKAGFYLRLWNYTTNAYYSDTAIEIDSVSGNIITMKSAFTTSLTTDIGITFPDFGSASTEQQIKYAWICPDTNKFADGKNAYQIIP